MEKLKIKLVVLIILFGKLSFGQVIISNNCLFTSTSEAIISVNQANLSNQGLITHAGHLFIDGSLINDEAINCATNIESSITLNGNWTNNNLFESGISNAIFNGGAQSINGTSTSEFYKVNLLGGNTDVKTAEVNIEIEDTLFLNDTRLELIDNIMRLDNAQIPVQRGNGYISMVYQGKVIANIANAASDIEIPLGYSDANLDYRPILLKAPGISSYELALYGNSPTDNSKSANALQDSLCSIQDQYYYWIKAGNSTLDYGLTLKGEQQFTKSALWQSGQWQKSSVSLVQNGLMNGNIPANQGRYVSLTQERPFVSAGDDIIMRTGNTAILRGVGYKPATAFINWSPDIDLSCNDCFQPTFTYGNQGKFSITIDNGPNCIATDTMNLVYWREVIFVENAFSPNDDDLNERFMPKLLTNERLINMEIFNRWGQKVYQGTDGWDGKYGGVKVQEGLYVYIMTVDQILLDGIKHIYNTRGTITIIP